MTAADHLFHIRDKKETNGLPYDKSVVFHHKVAQLLFICSISKSNIQTVASLIKTRVNKPDELN